MKKIVRHEPKTGGVPPRTPKRTNLYGKVALLAPKAIETLGKLLEHRNESVRVAAVKIVLSKTIPDLKGMEISGPEGEKLKVVIEYVDNDGKPIKSHRRKDKPSAKASRVQKGSR